MGAEFNEGGVSSMCRRMALSPCWEDEPIVGGGSWAAPAARQALYCCALSRSSGNTRTGVKMRVDCPTVSTCASSRGAKALTKVP